MSRKIYTHVLCGGMGTRLWPLSRRELPKQFVPLIGGKSLLQLTLERVRSVSAGITCITSERHRFLVIQDAERAKADTDLILEPIGRSTAPAIAVAALRAHPDALLMFVPSDHHIPDVQRFVDCIAAGVSAAESGSIVTFGIVPNHPSTAFGYIACPSAEGAPLMVPHVVTQFIEKPEKSVAESLLLQGGHFWNAGIFLARASCWLAEMQAHAPDVLLHCQQVVQQATKDQNQMLLPMEAFSLCPSISIDHAVLEKSSNVVMVPFEGAWSDVGSWSSVAELCAPDEDGNRLNGKAIAFQATNTFVHAPHRTVVALGTKDMLIVDTEDALLVADPNQSEELRRVVARLTDLNNSVAYSHRYARRPWGVYDLTDEGPRFKVKRITVNPGARLSLQRHHHRAEHWVVVTGTAKVTRDTEEFLLTENQSTYIPLGVIHRLENPGHIPLEIIEIQSGSYLGEDDIVRFDDNYGRADHEGIAMQPSQQAQ